MTIDTSIVLHRQRCKQKFIQKENLLYTCYRTRGIGKR
jgi:hypothetical protein